MKSEIGYEHYFLNYYLYLPFSQNQEEFVLKESLKLMHGMGIKKFSNSDELTKFLKEIDSLFDDFKNFCDCDVKAIKEKLKLKNKKRIEIILDDLRRGEDYENLFPNHLSSIVKGKNFDDKNLFDENDKITSNIIYGDYIYNNENVEVYLHQRTMKKVRYKKRSYSTIHPINKELIQKVTKEVNDLVKEMNSGDFINMNEKLSEEIKKLKEKF
jgi:hypothetical protein